MRISDWSSDVCSSDLMAAAIARRLGVAVSYVTFATPGEVADAVADDLWDICLIAEEPQRAETIAFCDAYVEIEATYLVPAGSPLQSIANVDRPGVRIPGSDPPASDRDSAVQGKSGAARLG